MTDTASLVDAGASQPPIEETAALKPEQVLAALRTRASGLTTTEVSERTERFGPNAVRSHHASAWSVLARQLRSPLLWLLLAAAAVSAVVGEGLDAIIIGIIVAGSVGLGFVNEFRAERAAEAMHSEIRHKVAATRDGQPVSVEVTHLVPGDIVHLGVGTIIPADLRLLTADNLECDESILTGESVPAEKSPEPVASGAALAELSSCLFMGTIVHEGSANAVVVATGASTQFGRIAVGLGERHPQTEFQLGLTRFSGLLAKVGGVLSVTIFVINIALGRPVIDAVLFSLAVAVGITPQLLPAVVSTSLATGSRRLAAKKVLVKRLVCIEDLGDIDVLFTDKTGTLTDGHISFERAIAGRATTVPTYSPSDSSATKPPRLVTPWSAATRSTSPCGKHPARHTARPVSSNGSRSFPSITTAAVCRCWPTATVNDFSSPRERPKGSWTAASTSPIPHTVCSTASSPRAIGWWRSPPASHLTSLRSRSTTSTT